MDPAAITTLLFIWVLPVYWVSRHLRVRGVRLRWVWGASCAASPLLPQLAMLVLLGASAYFSAQRRSLGSGFLEGPPEVHLANAASLALPLVIFVVCRIFYSKPPDERVTPVEVQRESRVEASAAVAESSDATHVGAMLPLVSLALLAVTVGVSLMASQTRTGVSTVVLLVLVLGSAPSVILGIVFAFLVGASRKLAKLYGACVALHFAVVLIWVAASLL